MKRFGFYPTLGEGVYLNHRLIAAVILVRDRSNHDREIIVYLTGVDRPITLTNGSATMLLEEIDPPEKEDRDPSSQSSPSGVGYRV